jgi:hypothetical protein
MISTNIPGSQRKAFFISFEKGEKDLYQAYEMKNCHRLFVYNSINLTKFHWNMGKLYCLVLVLLWLGFIFLEKSLSINYVVLVLNKLQKGQLVILWQKALLTISIIILDSKSESGADLLNKEQT